MKKLVLTVILLLVVIVCAVWMFRMFKPEGHVLAQVKEWPLYAAKSGDTVGEYFVVYGRGFNPDIICMFRDRHGYLSYLRPVQIPKDKYTIEIVDGDITPRLYISPTGWMEHASRKRFVLQISARTVQDSPWSKSPQH